MDIALEAIMAALLGCFATVFIAAATMICKSIRAKRFRIEAIQAPIPKPSTTLTSIAVEESVLFDPSLQISMSDIITATNNFSADLIAGDSRFGLVYKAELPNGLNLAVKKLDSSSFQCFMEFRSELEILGKLRHPNVVRLLGYCISGADRALIYEFFERGSLDICLHELYLNRAQFPLCWRTRKKIVVGVANGLAYMHDLKKPIIHRDVKSNNIFLDSQFEAHIADFGLARMVEAQHTHVSTQAAGTVGYMPPEYEEGYAVATVKGDVYSFGILMLEIATGKRPESRVAVDEKTTTSFMEWAKRMVAQNRESEMLDPNVWVWSSRRGLDESSIREYLRVSFMCTKSNPRERPTMREVVELLARDFM